jgi:phage terminase large subunit-like protein
LEEANNFKGRIALGGNRIGKSDQGAYECVLAVTGKHPFRKYPAQGKGWIVGLDYNMVRDINLPKFNKFLPRNYEISSEFSKADNIWWIRGEGREWKVQFKSSDSGRDKFQGDELDWIWFDEEPKKTDIFNECMMRLVDRAGIWWMTATPVNGTAWLKAQTEKTDTIYTTYGAMWDNPYLPLEEVESAASELSEEERLVRIEGQYVVFGGSPVFNIRLLTGMINALRSDEPVSTGFVEEIAA